MHPAIRTCFVGGTWWLEFLRDEAWPLVSLEQLSVRDPCSRLSWVLPIPQPPNHSLLRKASLQTLQMILTQSEHCSWIRI